MSMLGYPISVIKIGPRVYIYDAYFLSCKNYPLEVYWNHHLQKLRNWQMINHMKLSNDTLKDTRTTPFLQFSIPIQQVMQVTEAWLKKKHIDSFPVILLTLYVKPICMNFSTIH